MINKAMLENKELLRLLRLLNSINRVEDDCISEITDGEDFDSFGNLKLGK